MSMVAPNGQVRLFSNVPLDNKYEDTIYFSDKTAQTSYFLGLTPVHTMTGATRFKEGVIRCNVGEDTIRHCNYMMFQNMNFSTKWFYAFITGTEYVNNETTYVYYEIDEIQTWLYDGLTLKQCMIERQHSTSDAIYSNIIPEDVGAPELVINDGANSPKIGFKKGMSAVVFTSAELHAGQTPEWQACPIDSWNGILGCTEPTAYAENYIDNNGDVRSASWAVMESVIQDLIEGNKTDAIIAGVCIPSEFFSTGKTSQGFDRNYVMDRYTGTLDGYTPKNKKMYNSPYCVIRVQSSDGQTIYMKPELVSGSYLQFRIIPVVSASPEVCLIPRNYKGQDYDFEDSISFTKFPQFSIAADGYKAWVAAGGLATGELRVSQTERAGALAQAQNATDAGLSLLGSKSALNQNAVSTLGNVASNYVRQNPIGMATSASQGVSNANQIRLGSLKTVTDAVFTHKQIEQNITFANENFDLQHAIAKTLPPSMKGQSVGSSLATDGLIGFTIDKLTPRYAQAEAIDNYFTMYGYKQNKIAVPNLHARSRFTYIKTTNCKVEGGAPTEDITAVENIFNSGIRFWVSASDIGNYSSPNNVLS